MTADLDKIYTKKQQEILRFYFNNDFFMLINHGAKRSGKTVLDNDLLLAELQNVRERANEIGVRNPQYILAGADLSELKRNVIVELENKYGFDIKFDKSNRFKLFGVLVCCFGHSKINDLGRIRGMTAWGAYINEASVANEEVFNEIKSRCSAPGARLIMDTNPGAPSHWLKTDYIDKADGHTIAQYSWKLTDNTFLTDRYIDNIKASTPSGMFYDRDINGAWVAAEGVVYPDFSRDIHYITRDKLPQMEYYFAGVDFGWEHWGAAVLCGKGIDGNYYVIKGKASKHRDIEAWIQILQEYERKHPRLLIYCDSARPDLIDKISSAGLRAIDARKDVIAGISYVATLYHTKRLFIVKDDVEHFDDEIDNYVWDKEDKPHKTDDDVQDAIRYALYSDDWYGNR